MQIQKLIEQLIENRPHEELTDLFEGAANEMMDGSASPVQMAGLLSILRIQGESPHAVASFARVMRARAMPFDRPAGIILDTCGTGGDRSGTFNISTAAAFVVAGAGLPVAKHGNRSMSSKCGSADVLSALGVRIDANCTVMQEALRKANICFLFAQCFHSSMKHVAPVRKELGFRTIFNLVGPLSNPAKASHQLIGVFNLEQARLVADVLRLLETERAWVVYGEDGLDEISISGPTHCFDINGDSIREYTLRPEDGGLKTSSLNALKGGDAEENASIVQAILDGEEGPRQDIVLLNAGAAIHLGGLAQDLAEGVSMARVSLESGEARRRLEMLRNISHSETAAN